MRFSEKLMVIENVISIPLYSAFGLARNKLLYVSTVEGSRSLWMLDLDTNEKKLLAENVSLVSDVREDSPLLMYAIDVSGGREQHKAFILDIETMRRREVTDLPPRRITSICFDGDKFALSSSTDRTLDLWVIRKDALAEKVFEDNKLFFATDLEDNIIVGEGMLRGNPKSRELFAFNLDSNEFKIYSPKDGSTNKNPRIHGKQILFSTTAYGGEKLVVMDLSSGEKREPRFQYDDYRKYNFSEYVNWDWTRDGKIWFIGVRDGRTKVFYDGKLINVPDGYATRLIVSKNKFYVSWSSMTKPMGVLEINPDTETIDLLLGKDLPDKIRSKLGKIRFTRIRSFDGLDIPTFIIENAEIGEPGPTIIYVHGGPWSSVDDSWNRLIASLVASGFHVIAPNFRGSTGYGDEFRRMDIGDPGGGDLMDIIAVAKWAKEQGIASKLAIMGYSYGGYMTYLATVKEPDLWDAGVAGAGITDWEELYALSDALFRNFVDILFAGKKELLKDRSPKNYAENLKVPICIIHPQNDSRTPLKPVLNYVLKLLSLGKTFELHVIPDMGHLLNRVEDAVKVLFPAVIFLTKTIK